MYGCFIDDPRPYGLLISPMYGEALARENEWRLALPDVEVAQKNSWKIKITQDDLSKMVERVKALRIVEIAEIKARLDNPPMVWSEHFGRMVIDPSFHSERSMARARLRKLAKEPEAHKQWKKSKRELKVFREAVRLGLF